MTHDCVLVGNKRSDRHWARICPVIQCFRQRKRFFSVFEHVQVAATNATRQNFRQHLTAAWDGVGRGVDSQLPIVHNCCAHVATLFVCSSYAFTNMIPCESSTHERPTHSPSHIAPARSASVLCPHALRPSASRHAAYAVSGAPSRLCITV